GHAKPVLGEVGRVRETRGIAGHHPDARAAAATRSQVVDLAGVEARRSRLLVLDEDLGEIAARPQRVAQHALDHRFIDHWYPFRPAAHGAWPGIRYSVCHRRSP